MLLVRRVYFVICGVFNDIGNGSHYIVSNDKVVGK